MQGNLLNDKTVERIRQRAYEIFLHRGHNQGDGVSDWLQAEQEVCVEEVRRHQGPRESLTGISGDTSRGRRATI